MALAFVDQSSGGSDSTSSLGVTKPPSAGSGHYVLVFFSINGSSASVSGNDSGFTRIAAQGVTTFRSEVWGKLLDGSEGATLTFTLDSSRKVGYVADAYSGGGQATPIDNFAFTGSGQPPTTVTDVNNCWVVYGICTRSTTGAISVTPDAATTERSDKSQGTATPWLGAEAADEIQATAGTTTARTFTPTTIANRHNYTIALAPAGVALTKNVDDTASLAETRSEAPSHPVADSVALADAAIRGIHPLVAETLALADAVRDHAGLALGDVLALGDQTTVVNVPFSERWPASSDSRWPGTTDNRWAETAEGRWPSA